MSTPSFVYISASRRERDLFERDIEYERIPPFKSSLNEDDFRNDYGLFGYRSDIIDVHRSDQLRLSPSSAEYQGNLKISDVKNEPTILRNSPPSNTTGLHASWTFGAGSGRRWVELFDFSGIYLRIHFLIHVLTIRSRGVYYFKDFHRFHYCFSLTFYKCVWFFSGLQFVNFF